MALESQESPWKSRDSEAKSILVIGLGNPILSDDGVGWKVAEEVQSRLGNRQQGLAVEFDFLALGGLSLMERMVGYRHAVVIDAIQTGDQPVGTVNTYLLEELPDYAAGRTSAAHDTSLQTALKVGRGLGAALPEQVHVVTVEAEVLYDFSESMTPAVAAAVSPAALEVIKLLDQYQEN